MAKDPVCGMEVDESNARHTALHDGKTYYFCAAGCKKAFEAEPEKYLDPNYQARM
jgi:P-type Cu+ transporter